nr:hypothetical protein [uncultured Actinoplanes sp.]
MKLKLKLSKRQMMVPAILAVAAGGLMMSRSVADQPRGGVDGPARTACSDFAAGYAQARTKTARLALADRVTASSGRTANTAIAQRAAEMGRSADDDGEAWRSAARALTTACRDAGVRISYEM